MPLEQTNVIDEILQPSEERRIGLLIVDSGAVTEPALRLRLLREKLEHYVEAATEGSVDPRYRYTDPNDFFIDVVCARPPTEQMLQISEVAKEGDTKHRLRVAYRELQEGMWTEAPPVEPAVAMENVETDSLDAIINAAFEAGHEALRAGTAPFLLLFVKAGQAFLLPVKGVDSHEQVAPTLVKWAEENSADVSACVFIYFVAGQNNGGQRHTLGAHVFQRGAKEGIILAQELHEDNGAYHGCGTLLFLGCGDNILGPCSS
jgi:hypothetical protein